MFQSYYYYCSINTWTQSYKTYKLVLLYNDKIRSYLKYSSILLIIELSAYYKNVKFFSNLSFIGLGPHFFSHSFRLRKEKDKKVWCKLDRKFFFPFPFAFVVNKFVVNARAREKTLNLNRRGS